MYHSRSQIERPRVAPLVKHDLETVHLRVGRFSSGSRAPGPDFASISEGEELLFVLGGGLPATTEVNERSRGAESGSACDLGDVSGREPVLGRLLREVGPVSGHVREEDEAVLGDHAVAEVPGTDKVGKGARLGVVGVVIP